MTELIDKIFPYVFPFLFIGGWCFVLNQLSIKSGWNNLADKYHFPEKFIGNYYRFQSAKFKKINYGSCLEIGINENGMFFIPFIPFRLFHKPIFIPWDDIKSEPFKSLFFKGYRLNVLTCPDITIDVHKRVFKKMDSYLMG